MAGDTVPTDGVIVGPEQVLTNFLTKTAAVPTTLEHMMEPLRRRILKESV